MSEPVAPLTDRDAAALAARQAAEAADQAHARQVEKLGTIYGQPADAAHTWDEATQQYVTPETRQDQRAEQIAHIRAELATAEAAGDRAAVMRLKAALVLLQP